MEKNDVLVIGSGMAGVHTALALIEKGKKVTMIDGGIKPDWIPQYCNNNFEDVRLHRQNQYELFLGKDLSAIPVDGLSGGLGGGQLSGNRSYVVKNCNTEIPLKTKQMSIVQSLAEGGLGAAWGAACSIPTKEELNEMGLREDRMQGPFNQVIEEIGVSGEGYEKFMNLQKPIRLDHHGGNVQKMYQKKKKVLEKMNIHVAQPLQAILTEDKDDRRAHKLTDMDYWCDEGKSVYRPQYTLEKLKRSPLFTYEAGWIVEKIEENTGVSVIAKKIGGEERRSWSGSTVILAAGAIGSARIILQSLKLLNSPLPLAAKPHVFTACIDLQSLGRSGPRERMSLCQLVVVDHNNKKNLRAGCAQLYSYRSLQLFRLLSAAPLPVPEALRLLSVWSPSLVIADIRFPALPQCGSICLKEEKGTLFIEVASLMDEKEHNERNKTWKRLRKALRVLGLLPVKNMILPEGSTSHYGGTLPYSNDDSKNLTTDGNGKLRGMKNVYVADASVFPVLPSLPHTLTIMANARRIGMHISELITS